MSKKKYLIACLDNEDKNNEMEEMYLVICHFFSRGSFKLDKQRAVIENGSLYFYFKTPQEIQCIDGNKKFNSVAQSDNFRQFASFDSKTPYKFFERKLGKNGKQGILQKLSESRQ